MLGFVPIIVHCEIKPICLSNFRVHFVLTINFWSIICAFVHPRCRFVLIYFTLLYDRGSRKSKREFSNLQQVFHQSNSGHHTDTLSREDVSVASVRLLGYKPSKVKLDFYLNCYCINEIAQRLKVEEVGILNKGKTTCYQKVNERCHLSVH